MRTVVHTPTQELFKEILNTKQHTNEMDEWFEY